MPRNGRKTTHGEDNRREEEEEDSLFLKSLAQFLIDSTRVVNVEVQEMKIILLILGHAFLRTQAYYVVSTTGHQFRLNATPSAPPPSFTQSLLTITTAIFPSPPTTHQLLATKITTLSDKIVSLPPITPKKFNFKVKLHESSLRLYRRTLLADLMKENYTTYITTATFLSQVIPRSELPNVQDIPFPEFSSFSLACTDENETPNLLYDSPLPEKIFTSNFLDKILLSLFRNTWISQTNSQKSALSGIDGLVEEGRNYMLSPEGQLPNSEGARNQQVKVMQTLRQLFTPLMPPFFKIFMAGVIPDFIVFPESLVGKRFGPWFYAPLLTTLITPTFFNFLVGPSTVNFKKNGELGGLLVEKCKFLQKSKCKGICLNQCKLPIQEFFKDDLGMELTVSPNFVTQECQWSWGEKPVEVANDPSWPKGCVKGCESRQLVVESQS